MPADRRPRARGGRPPARKPRSSTARATSSRDRRPAARPRPASRPPAKRAPARPPARAAVDEPASTTRLTGRAGVLVLVLAVLAVSYASSLRAYLQQRGEIQEYQRTIAERRVDIAALEREKKRWEDPNFVRAQARERLGYVMPGETPFVVLRDGEPLEAESELTDPDSVAPEKPTAWWDTAWESVEIAGDPQKRTRPPLTRVGEEDGTGSD